VLQSLREPLEDKVITIVRAEGPQKLPADFQLIMAANSCPCGRLGAPAGHDDFTKSTDPGCFCSPDEINRYWRKLGGALLDRIDLRLPVRAPGILTPGGGGGEKSCEIRQRVIKATEIQRERFAEPEICGSHNRLLKIRRNSGINPGQMEKFCPLTKEAEEVFIVSASKLCFSGRACHSVLKVARTIADLEGKEVINSAHILEAVQYRRYGDDAYDILSQQ
jgi:magnesium chelatase family protein